MKQVYTVSGTIFTVADDVAEELVVGKLTGWVQLSVRLYGSDVSRTCWLNRAAIVAVL